MDHRARRPHRGETSLGPETPPPKRPRNLRALPAADRADLFGRRSAHGRRALQPAAAVATGGRTDAVRYHAAVTRSAWWRRFSVRGVVWRQLLRFAILNVPPWIEPIIMAFWSTF